MVIWKLSAVDVDCVTAAEPSSINVLAVEAVSTVQVAELRLDENADTPAEVPPVVNGEPGAVQVFPIIGESEQNWTTIPAMDVVLAGVQLTV